jgi:serine protease Do
VGVEKGVEVRALTEGDTPARKAGLQPGDVIISVNGQPVTETKALQAMVTKTNPGDKVHFSIVRGGERKNVDVVVEEQPESFGMRREMFAQRRPPKREERPQVRAVQKLGVKVQEVTAGLANRLNIEPGNGVVVTEVDPDGIAANANLVPGSVILQVENAPVKGPEDLNQAMAKADLDKGVLMQVRLPDGTARLMIVKK